MFDLLVRAGWLQEVFEIIRCMPFEPTEGIWGSLLVYYKSQGDFEFSEFTARKLVEMKPDKIAYYVQLSNLYAEEGRWKIE